MKRAMLLVKGKDAEKQRAICEAFAKEQGYYIKGVTDSLQYASDMSVTYDVLIAAGKTRISEHKRNYDKVIEMFDEMGIDVIIAE